MRVAGLADIHGSLPALEAVLRDVEAARADAVVLNGDLADGPMPAQTLDRLDDLGEQAIWVRGNTDRWLADTRRIINPGSVGLPYGHPGAAWALLGPDVVLRRTAYDTDAAAAAVSAAASDLPGIGSWPPSAR